MSICGTQQLDNSVMPCEMAAADGVLSDGQNAISNVQRAKHDRCRELGQQQLWRNVTVSIKFVASTLWKFGIRWIEKIQSEYRTSSVMDTLPPGSTQAGHDSYRDLFNTTTVVA